MQEPNKIVESTRNAVSLVKSLEPNWIMTMSGLMQIVLNRFGNHAAPNTVPFDNSQMRKVKINAKILGRTQLYLFDLFNLFISFICFICFICISVYLFYLYICYLFSIISMLSNVFQFFELPTNECK